MTEIIGLCAIAKNEGPYIEEWVRYHLSIGFNNITIYNNESENDAGLSLVKAIPGVRIIDWLNVEGEKPQISAYTNFLNGNNDHFDWIMYLDLDEFFNPKRARSVHEFVSDYKDFDAVAVNWRMFGSSGLTNRTSGGVLDRFKLASPEAYGPNAHIKTIFRPAAALSPSVHSPYFKEAARFVDTHKRALPIKDPNCLQHDIRLDIAQINHYFTKSKEEFDQKRARGRADLEYGRADRYRSEEEFAMYDRNDEIDTSILRHFAPMA